MAVNERTEARESLVRETRDFAATMGFEDWTPAIEVGAGRGKAEPAAFLKSSYALLAAWQVGQPEPGLFQELRRRVVGREQRLDLRLDLRPIGAAVPEFRPAVRRQAPGLFE